MCGLTVNRRLLLIFKVTQKSNKMIDKKSTAMLNTENKEVEIFVASKIGSFKRKSELNTLIFLLSFKVLRL